MRVLLVIAAAITMAACARTGQEVRPDAGREAADTRRGASASGTRGVQDSAGTQDRAGSSAGVGGVIGPSGAAARSAATAPGGAASNSQAPQASGSQTTAALDRRRAVDNLLAGYDAGDYSAFSRDFSPTLRAGISEASFRDGDFKHRIVDVIGRHVRCRSAGTDTSQPGNVTDIYACAFTADDPVTMRVQFSSQGSLAVSGLLFDSAKLRR